MALGCLAARTRSPEAGEREFPEVLFDGGTNRIRPGINVKELPAIGRVDGARGNGVIDGGVHVVPPEKIGTGKARQELSQVIPDFRPLDKPVGLLPEMNFCEIAVVPTVGHGTML